MARLQTVVGASSLELTADTDANDSDKTFTVDSLERWHVYSVFVSLVTTATVGNRQVRVDFMDSSSNVFCTVLAGAVQAASATVNYSFAPGLPHLTAAVGTELEAPLPATMVLLPGYKIRVYDSAAVAASADDMTVRILANRSKTKDVEAF